MNLEQLYQSGVISEIDRAFAEMIDRRLGGIDPWVALGAALVSRAAACGDVCADLAVLTRAGFQASDSGEVIPVDIPLGAWLEKLSISPAVGILNENKPMILDGCRLYLQRYWKYENIVVNGILERCGSVDDHPIAPFPFDPSAGPRFYQGDYDQERAIHTALTRRFAVISGGPGTGKTFTIARIMLTLHRLHPNRNLRIRLAAPTGKAAARLQEALEKAFAVLYHCEGQDSDTDIEAQTTPQTLHRLLGAIPGKTRFHFNAQNQLPADVVIVDEASMIDLALMAKLIQAIPGSSRLILVGDKDQLASVEAGAILGDICAGPNIDDSGAGDSGSHWNQPSISADSVEKADGTGLGEHIVVLRNNYRFDGNSGIDALGASINAGDIERTLDLLESAARPDVALKTFATRKDMEAALEQLVLEKIAPIFAIPDALKALQQFSLLKILTPLRKGPQGVEVLNQWVENLLLRHDVIQPLHGNAIQWYSGRPVMITCNDYYHNLFNGDVGIAMDTANDRYSSLQVLFPEPKQGLKVLAPEQLPAHETVYAMTVHKSQGTEFGTVVLVLPDMDVPLLTRELLYTAITRARQRVEIWGRPDILKKAIPRRIKRASGLRQNLWPQGHS